MDQNTLLVIIAVFVFVAAVALCIQAGFLFALYKTTAALEKKMMPMVPKVEALIPKIEALLPKVDSLFLKAEGLMTKVEPIIPKVEAVVPKVGAFIDSATLAVQDGSKQVHEITDQVAHALGKANDILETGKAQMARVDDLMGDATSRARIQLDRVEMVIDDTMNRTQQTVALVHSNVMKPLREIQGIHAGVRAAFNFFTRGRNGPTDATADEEMFI